MNRSNDDLKISIQIDCFIMIHMITFSFIRIERLEATRKFKYSVRFLPVRDAKKILLLKKSAVKQGSTFHDEGDGEPGRIRAQERVPEPRVRVRSGQAARQVCVVGMPMRQK